MTDPTPSSSPYGRPLATPAEDHPVAIDPAPSSSDPDEHAPSTSTEPASPERPAGPRTGIVVLAVFTALFLPIPMQMAYEMHPLVALAVPGWTTWTAYRAWNTDRQRAIVILVFTAIWLFLLAPELGLMEPAPDFG